MWPRRNGAGRRYTRLMNENRSPRFTGSTMKLLAMMRQPEAGAAVIAAVGFVPTATNITTSAVIRAKKSRSDPVGATAIRDPATVAVLAVVSAATCTGT